MVSIQKLRKLALSFPEASEEPHFEKSSFRVKKKIFATIDSKSKIACLKLSPGDQDIFSRFDNTAIYAVPNKWGQQGWTYIHLDKIKSEIFNDVLLAAYCEVAPKKLAELVRPKINEI